MDACSKFPEVVKMTNSCGRTTVSSLDIFSTCGFPKIIVSDNGLQFLSAEFRQFCSSNEILDRTSAAYKPSLSSSCVIIQAQNTKADSATVIAKYLLINGTPHSSTGKPAFLTLMGWRLRAHLDLLISSIETHGEPRQYKSMICRTAHSSLLVTLF